MADEARSDLMTSGSDEGEEQPPNGSDEDKTPMDPDILKEEATRMLKIFRQIAECLEKVVVVEIKEMLSDVMSISRTADDDNKDEQLTQVYFRFIDKVEFRAGISVNLIAQAIRGFMMIEDDTEGLGKTVSDMYLEMIVTDHPSLAIDMQLSDELLKVYFKLLGEGYEEMQHIRLMVVGMFGVGKTTLVRKLCGKGIDDVESTVGIDIFQNSCEIKEDFNWEVSSTDKKEKFLNFRLQELITKYRKQDKKSETSTVTRSQVVEQTTITPRNDTPEYDDFKRSVTRNDQKQKPEDKIVEELKEIAKNEGEPLERRPTVSIWDFAGQSVYYSTHHFFLNARSVYILVLDLSQDLHAKVKEENCMNMHPNMKLGNITSEYTCLETFKFWMKSIYIYTKQKKASLPYDQKDEYTPKIILVGTFKDKISSEMLNGRKPEVYKDDYFRDALLCFKDTPIHKLVHGRTFLISNKESDEGEFVFIKKEIYNISTEMPFWNEKVPAKFIPLEKAIFQQKKNKRHTMKFSELKEVGLNVEYPNDETEIQLFLTFQHAFGNVLYYNMGTHTDQEDRSDLSELIVLTPQWIIDAFKAFVTHKDKTNEISKLESWEKFENYGILGNDLIDALLQHYNPEDRDKILMYMEYLEVIARPVVLSSKSDNDSRSSSAKSEGKYCFLDCPMETQTKEGDFYVMPCMLPPRPEMDKLKDLYEEPDKDTHHTTLCIFIKNGFLPAFILHRILATTMKKFPIATSGGVSLLFNGLGSFNLDVKRMLTIWSIDNIIHLRVTFKGDCKDEKEEISFCKALREHFEKVVLELFNFHGKNTYDVANPAKLFSLYVKCPGCKEQVPFDEIKHRVTGKPIDYMIGLHDMEKLSNDKELSCGCCKEQITAKQALKYWFTNEQQPVDTLVLTEEENELLATKVKPCKLLELSFEIKSNIQTLLYELEINDTMYGQLTNKSKHCGEVFGILICWENRGYDWKHLYAAMKRAEIETKHFFRILKGKDSKMIEKKIKENLEQIKMNGDEELKLKTSQIAKLSKCFGKQYWCFGILLGLTDEEMEMIEYANPGSIPKQITAILDYWNRKIRTSRKFVRAVVLSECKWRAIREILKDP